MTFLLDVLENVNSDVSLSIVGPIEDKTYWNKCLIRFNNLKVNNNAEKIINEFHLISINTDNNIKLLEIISKTQEFIGNEDWMYLYLALIEINKKNIELAKKYLNLSENVTNNSKIIKKIKELERELKSE